MNKLFEKIYNQCLKEHWTDNVYDEFSSELYKLCKKLYNNDLWDDFYKKQIYEIVNEAIEKYDKMK